MVKQKMDILMNFSRKHFFHNKVLGLFVKTNGIISQPIYSGFCHIFMLHRIKEQPALYGLNANKGLVISIPKLEEIIIFFKERGFNFISLDKLYQLLQTGCKSGKYICITLDDGYKDNLEVGLPFFEKHQIPFTIYVTTCFPDLTAFLWWYHLEDFLLENEIVDFEYQNLVFRFPLKTLIEKENAFYQLRTFFLSLSPLNQRGFLYKLCNINENLVREKCMREAMGWSEVKTISQHPLVTIGAHTISHVPLINLSIEEKKNEIVGSKEKLEHVIKKPVNHFAYPYGGINEAGPSDYQVVKRAGFTTATTNIRGNIFKESRNYLECLPRMPLGEVTSHLELEYITNGINHFANNYFRRVHSYKV